MTIELLVPVMMICVTTTTPEVNDGAYSTVAKMEIRGCTPCNQAVKDCEVPADFQKFVRDLVAKEMAKAQSAPKSAEAEKPKKPAKRKPRRK